MTDVNYRVSCHELVPQLHFVPMSHKREIIWDEEARRTFLTGFHKRKQHAKAEAARKAAERQKKERQEFRREQRRLLRERAAENAAKVERAYGAIMGTADDDDDDGEGEGETPTGEQQTEQAYEDEQVLATVAVVEDFEPEPGIYGETSRSVRVEPPERTASHKAEKVKKVKPNKVRYQTKGARKAERSKQLARRTEKAERAGGKGRRSKR